MYGEFLRERVKIGEGMTAQVFSWRGCAYKCFYEGYPAEWLEYERRLQDEICRSGLPVPRYYRSEFPGSIKMELITGVSMYEKIKSGGKEKALADLMTWFGRVHEVRGLRLNSVSDYLLAETDAAPVTEGQKVLARRWLTELENAGGEEDVLCHMDFHPLNLLYEGEDIRIIDWLDAKSGKPIWDHARTYLIFFENAPDMAAAYLERLLASEGYPENAFMKAVYVSAMRSVRHGDAQRIGQLMHGLEQGLTHGRA